MTVLQAALVAALGSAAIVLLAILALSATPPVPRQPAMRVSVSLAHDVLPVSLTLEKDAPCLDAC